MVTVRAVSVKVVIVDTLTSVAVLLTTSVMVEVARERQEQAAEICAHSYCWTPEGADGQSVGAGSVGSGVEDDSTTLEDTVADGSVVTEDEVDDISTALEVVVDETSTALELAVEDDTTRLETAVEDTSTTLEDVGYADSIRLE
jgi:hypothetical protein